MSLEVSKVLSEELEKRRSKNPKYSLRSFARDLDLSPSMVSRFLTGERSPSLETLQKMMKVLGLEERLRQLGMMIPKDEEYVRLSLQQREQINDWLFSSLMELFRSKKRTLSISGAAKALGQPMKEIERRVRVLVSLGLLKKTDRGYRTVAIKQSSIGLGKVVHQIHEGYLERAKKALEKESAPGISGATILIHPSRLEEARTRIREFRRSLSSFLAVKPEETEEELFRIQIALFSLEEN